MCCVTPLVNVPAPLDIYPLSLHDALPISEKERDFGGCRCQAFQITGDLSRTDPVCDKSPDHEQDRKSTRLNSSHVKVSYAVFCFKKKRGSTTSIRQPNHQRL